MAHRIHRTVSADGTEVAGRVHGQGPALVLVHGGLGDGETSWRFLLPHLVDRFTCYAMSTRGRGLSADHDDHTLDALVADVVAFADSIDEPVGLVGWSLGGATALGAAAASPAVSAVAVYEPAVFEVASDVNPTDSEAKASAVAGAASDGRPAQAARAMIEDVATREELAALGAVGAFEAWAPNMAVVVRGVQAVKAGLAAGGASPTSRSTLADLAAPLLYLHGSETPTTWYIEGARHVARHAADVRIAEVSGVGHFAPILQPQVLADALVPFFETATRPAGA
jgi:pimeloyl-ACP methyl ester carboxylesterase